MFRTLSGLLTAAGNPPEALFTIHPLQLSRWLEEAWAQTGVANWPGFPERPLAITAETVRRLQLPTEPAPGLLGSLRSGVDIPGQFSPSPALGTAGGNALPWDHLIYAYLVESTGIVEILREVVRRYVVGETLEAGQNVTYSWMRATEELFFRDPPLFSITSTVSALRPDQQVNRRNAYWRMFGMDLPHPVSGLDGQPWKSDVGAAANLRFGEVWLELLRQVWMGIENDTNAVGANPTDPDYVAYLCRTIGEMMAMRRRAGMLSREEFGYVVMMSWFHLLVDTDNGVLTDLQAGVGGAGGAGGNAGDRLGRIAQRVGITPPRRARELFELADLASPVLHFIESGRFNDAGDAVLLFRRGSATPVIQQTMNRLINLWQSATGERIKDAAVRLGAGPAPAQPTRLPSAQQPSVQQPSVQQPSPPVAATSTTNGHAPLARR